MPKKTSSRSQSTTTTVLALSSGHIRLEVLDKEHQRLLKKINKKKTELNNFVEQMRSLGADIFNRCTPSFHKLVDIDQEIHALFAEIFATRKLGKKSKKDIEGVYRSMQLMGIISPKRDHQDIDTDSEAEVLETNEEENDDSSSQRQNYYRDQEAPQDLEIPSRNKTDASRKIREIFLSLAEVFHPDKAKNGETQMRHTEIMKEINKAYQDGDLARLLEIEQQHQLGEIIDKNNEDDLTRKCTRLEQHNELLKNQFNQLKRELSEVKHTPEGTMVSDCRKAVKVGIDPVAQMLNQLESEIEKIAAIRDFVKDFREEKTSIKEFLGGPQILRQMQEDDMEDLLDEMFADFDEIMAF
ncbi:MAG: J domain-containing protein [Gloeotrichia echinulata CP02]